MNKEVQRYGRNKSVAINHTYIESGEYRKKFDRISDNKELNKLLYDLSKKMLCHRSGTFYEDMYWIDLDICKVVARELNCKYERRVVYSKATRKAIKKYPHILTLHSHPSSGPPSAEDLNANLKYGYDMGIVCCHDGKIYRYSSNQYIHKWSYSFLVSSYLKECGDNTKAQLLALEEFMKKYDIFIKEVLL